MYVKRESQLQRVVGQEQSIPMSIVESIRVVLRFSHAAQCVAVGGDIGQSSWTIGRSKTERT